MRIKVDKDLPRAATRMLQDQGHQALSVEEQGMGRLSAVVPRPHEGGASFVCSPAASSTTSVRNARRTAEHRRCTRLTPDSKAVLYTSDLTGYSNMYLVEIGHFDELPDLE